LDLFNSTLKKLLSGEEAKIPTFNFVISKKEFNDNYIKIKDNSIV